MAQLTATLLVTGSIAAYKAIDLMRDLQRRGLRVRVAMSKAAQEFVRPLSFEVLSGEKVAIDLFNQNEEQSIGHISLANDTDLIIVAPATADLLNKAAQGIADDVVTAVLLATTKPVIYVPAMNVKMWQNSVTQESIKALKTRGAIFVDPVEGKLACGWMGKGHFPENAEIMSVVETLLNLSTDLKRTRVIITAGPTREWIDPIRFLSNRSSGLMGQALAEIAKKRGAHVDLVLGPVDHALTGADRVVQVSTALEMAQQVETYLGEQVPGIEHTIVIFAAAVCDHRPKSVSSNKLKVSKSESYSIELVPNPDIAFEVGSRREVYQAALKTKLTLIGFAAESGDFSDLEALARRKLQAKHLDYVVGNLLDSFETDRTRAVMVNQTDASVFSKGSKIELADFIFTNVSKL